MITLRFTMEARDEPGLGVRDLGGMGYRILNGGGQAVTSRFFIGYVSFRGCP